MRLRWRRWLKAGLGKVPGLAELDWALRGQHRLREGAYHKALRQTAPYLDRWAPWAAEQQRRHSGGRTVALFATLPYWVAHVAVLGLALAARGHRVVLGYLPYVRWTDEETDWTLRKRALRWQALFRRWAPPLEPVALHRRWTGTPPAAWEPWLRCLAALDVEYTLQREGVGEDDPLFHRRLRAHRQAAAWLLRWLEQLRPDVLVVPNAAVLEFATAYQVAQALEIPVVSYEFEYLRERVWLAQGEPVMHLNTDDLWAVAGERPLTPEQQALLEEMMTARRGGRTWGVHARAWQRVDRAGPEAVRRRLGLDDRPLALLATNVFGDSVTLGRQVFSQGMTDWLVETLRFFAAHPEVQLVVRVHPGESMLAPGGTSMLEVVQRTLPDLPEHIKVVPPEADVNSYDLMALASLGLVYTTTLGLEMAMDGIPVIVAGRAHYRGRGFTLDPETWADYRAWLQRWVEDAASVRLTPVQVEQAQRYAYHFFFTYPRPYPWHLLFWEEDLARWPLERVLSEPAFVETLDCFAGEPLPWERWVQTGASLQGERKA